MDAFIVEMIDEMLVGTDDPDDPSEAPADVIVELMAEIIAEMLSDVFININELM